MFLTRTILARLAAAAFALALVAAPPAVRAQDAGFFTLTGEDAAGYAAPADMTLIQSMEMGALGLTYERYQQTFEGAEVLGGQVTIHRDANGDVVRVIGAHYPDIAPTNSRRVTPQRAGGLVDRDIGPDGERQVSLMIDPASGRFFYRVETRRAESRWVHWIGADDGAVMNKFDALTNQACVNGTGFGRAYDRDTSLYGEDLKILDCLITLSGDGTRLVSQGGRQETHDQGSSRRPFLGPIATNNDNTWDTPGRESPGTGALVDAHYYVALADQYFLSRYGFDFTAPNGYNKPIVIHGHYTKNYVNAFWNGSYFGFGDGDGVNYDPLTSMDVAAHEFTHSVTEKTSNLIYQNESGALNESFSDIMAAVIERLSDDGVLTPEPDSDLGVDNSLPDSHWLVGEDFDLKGDGFRNMKDPTADGDPANYADRYTGTGDNGGVHINSGISNHAFYRLVDLKGVSIQDAANIFFFAYTSLPSNATFCNARAATIANADVNHTDRTAEVTAVWDEVGVTAALCGGGNTPPNADFSSACTNLSCTFTDQSSDPDGSIASRAWNFGDGGTSTAANPSHTYAADGTYTVMLTVTDNGGLQASTSRSVTVAAGGGFTLTGSTFKVKGVRWATLTWQGAPAGSVDIYIGATKVKTVASTASPQDVEVGGRGGGSFTARVCEAGSTTTCSNTVNLIY